MIRAATRMTLAAALLALTTCGGDKPAAGPGQSRMAAKAVADVDAATAEANVAAQTSPSPNSTGHGTKSAP